MVRPGSMSSRTLASCFRAAAAMAFQSMTPRRTNRPSQPRKMFSITVRFGIRDCSWKTMPIPFSIAWRGLAKRTGLPSISTWPPSG